MEEVLMRLISLWMGIVAEEQQLKAVGMYKQVFEKIHFFKYLHKILLINSGISQGNYPYLIIV